MAGKLMNFELPKGQSSIIKVIGVGGGGGNAVNHMFSEGIKGVDFVICNTDSQALDNSPVPHKIQLGAGLTEGLGAGGDPEVGKNSALENIEQIKEILESNTHMVFITAGMGGGTGTGGAPVIAAIARELGILTVGIVTIPFSNEGPKRKLQAQEGLDRLRASVDALIIICNDKLREMYGNLRLSTAFLQADNVLATAAKGIAEMISVHGTINVDFRDVKTVMKDSGVAIMGSAVAEGDNRAVKAVEMALASPLLNDNKITGASYVLLNITTGIEEPLLDEITEINDYVQTEAGNTANVIMGVGSDEALEDKLSVTIIAAGFATNPDLGFIAPKVPEKIVRDLNAPPDSKAIVHLLDEDDDTEDFKEKTPVFPPIIEAKAKAEDEEIDQKPTIDDEGKEVFTLNMDDEDEEKNVEAKPETIVDDASGDKEVEPFKLIEKEDIKEKENPIENIEPDATFMVDKKPAEENNLQEEQKDDTPLEEAEPNAEDTAKPKSAEELLAEAETNAEATNKEEPIVPADETPAEKEEIEESSLEEQQEELPEFKLMDESEDLGANKTESTFEFDLTADDSKPLSERHLDDDKPGSTDSLSEISNASSLDNTTPMNQQERISKLKELSYKLKTPSGVSDMENEPAYRRRNVKLDDVPHSSESEVSKYTLNDSEDEDDKAKLRPDNPFLHDNVD